MSSANPSTRIAIPRAAAVYEEFEEEPSETDTNSTPPVPQPSGLVSFFSGIFSQFQSVPLHPLSSYAKLAAACGYTGKVANLRNWAKIRRLKAGCVVHNDILTYIRNSKNGRLVVKEIYKVDRKDEEDLEFDEPYRLMLWHGTPAKNIPGIIQSGFRKGKLGYFGAGVYFADRIELSQGYATASYSSGNRFFILAEVSLGKVYKARTTHHTYTTAPAGFDTVKGMGSDIPDWSENKKYYDAILPCGPTIKATRHQRYYLPHNEYIVYNPDDRIKIRFIVQCQ